MGSSRFTILQVLKTGIYDINFLRFVNKQGVDGSGFLCYDSHNFIEDDDGMNSFQDVSESRRRLRAGTE